MSSKKYMTVAEVAEELRLTPKGVQRLCRDKILGSSKPGKSYLIPRESLDEYLKIIR
jgi:excisionase family DNA binding protein